MHQLPRERLSLSYTHIIYISKSSVFCFVCCLCVFFCWDRGKLSNNNNNNNNEEAAGSAELCECEHGREKRDARAAGGVGSSKNAQLWLFKIIIIINNWVTCS